MDRAKMLTLLGLPAEFSMELLRSQYLKLVKKYHPDRNTGSVTMAAWLDMKEWYELLCKEKQEQLDFVGLRGEAEKYNKETAGKHEREGKKFDVMKFNKQFEEHFGKDAYDDGYDEWFKDSSIDHKAKGTLQCFTEHKGMPGELSSLKPSFSTALTAKHASHGATTKITGTDIKEAFSTVILPDQTTEKRLRLDEWRDELPLDQLFSRAKAGQTSVPTMSPQDRAAMENELEMQRFLEKQVAEEFKAKSDDMIGYYLRSQRLIEQQQTRQTMHTRHTMHTHY
jgi:curved DNA-binding protein CbpA